MTRGAGSWLGLALAALVLALAVDATARAPAGTLLVQPVAPPLTRLSILGDRTLGAPPPDRRAPPPVRTHRLRVAVEADAIAIAELLGPARVDAALARRERWSARLAETATWDRLVEALATAPSAPATPP